MKTGLAVFIKDDNIDDIQDFDRRGMDKNWNWGVFEWPDPAQIPFITPPIAKVASNAIATYKYRRIEILNGYKTYKGTTYDYTIDKSTIKTDVGEIVMERYYSDMSKPLGSIRTGLYELYLEDTEGNKFISNPVWISNTCEEYAADYADYDSRDYDSRDYATD
jgi:hypothetical protein